ncbi:MAG: hypothetical protein HOP08_09345 [Cyclobacteriaceae bacterium]|nr:hypothetical protein [Cyclobacteriaceae bacterium]
MLLVIGTGVILISTLILMYAFISKTKNAERLTPLLYRAIPILLVNTYILSHATNQPLA